MKWNKFISSIVMMLLCAMSAVAGDSITVHQQESTYEHNMERRQRAWASLIPTHFLIQNAGNMGVLSAGIGWGYGRQHWETHLLWGYIPMLHISLFSFYYI